MRHPLSRWLGVLALLSLLVVAGAMALNLEQFRIDEIGSAGAATLPLAPLRQSGVGEDSPLPTMTSTPILPTPGKIILVATAYVVATPRPEWYTTPTATQPPSTPTPLPTVSAENKSPYAAHNLVLVPGPTPVSPRLRDPDSSTAPSFMDWSPDGNFLALSVEVGETKFYPDSEGESTGTFWAPWMIYLFDAAGQEIGPIVEGIEPLWSPMGRYIAAIEWNMDQMEGSVKIWDGNTRQVSIAASLNKSHSRVIKAWISDTELAFYLGSQVQGELLVFDVTSGQLVSLLDKRIIAEIAQDAPEENLRVISSLPTKGLISITTRETVFILQRDQTGLQMRGKLRIHADGHPIFSPDGGAVALLNPMGVQIISLIDPNMPPVGIPYYSYRSFPLIWSPDGSSLAFPGRYGDWSGKWFVINRDGSGLRQLTELSEKTYNLMWTIRGMWAVSGEGMDFARFFVAFQS